MRQSKQTPGDRIVKDIKRNTRKRYSAEEKIRIVLDGLRGEESISELCRQEGLAQGLYYKWSKDFLEAGKKRLAGDITRQANTSEVKGLRSEARELKECVAELTLEIISLVERSSRPAKWTLDKLGVPRRTFYRWYDRYLEYGEDGLIDRAPMPLLVWNKIPDGIRRELLNMALDLPELSPRELAVRFTDTKGYFVSESSV